MKSDIFSLKQYNYEIPPELIAQEPLHERAESRLLMVFKERNTWEEVIFKDIVSFLREGDVVVINNTKVIKARLMGRKKTGGRVEILLIKERNEGVWEALVKPGKRAKVGNTLFFGEDGEFCAYVRDRTVQGGRVLEFSPSQIRPLLEIHGKMPVPPYIKKEVENDGQYQTVYAEREGSVAAPTAGFHFTPDIFNRMRRKGVEIVYVTLHCGLPTFRPIKTSDIREHNMEEEIFEISEETALRITAAKQQRRRVLGVGTTTIRTLESAALTGAVGVEAFPSEAGTELYILPGYRFKVIDAVVTNFHTPCSTNLVLISTFGGLDLIQRAYRYAIQKKFRFFSFGDAMCII